MKDHILVEPLPWQRPSDLTRCGKSTAPGLTAVEPTDFLEQLDAIPNGRRRIIADPGIMPGFCSICAVGSATATFFSEHPGVTVRAAADRSMIDPARRVALDAELLALADLAAAHPDEFATLRDRYHAMLLFQRGWSP